MPTSIRSRETVAVLGAGVASICLVVSALIGPAPLAAQGAGVPNITGAWVPFGGGRGVDPAIAPLAPGPIVLKAPYAREYEARRQADAEATKRGDPPVSDAVLCSPYGLPRMMAVASYPVEFLQTAGQITIVTEAFSEVRRVFMDQSQLPLDEVPPGYYGHSVGRWENGVLLIDTVGIKTSVPGYQNIPHSEQMRVQERIRLVAPDVLHDEITIADPVVLEKPVVYTLAYRRLRDYKMVEFVCDNNREYVDEKGRVRMRLDSGGR